VSTATNALDVLRDVFGYPAFRGAQADIIQHIQNGGDALVLMPTGGYFYYINNSVDCRPVDMAGVDKDLSQPTAPNQKTIFRFMPDLIENSEIFTLSKAKRLRTSFQC
jgi:hypothetical protein